MKRTIALILTGIIAATIGGGVAFAVDLGYPSSADIIKVRELGGIPPCKHEDGSRQGSICYWNGQLRGNGDGYSYLAVPDGRDADDDDDIIYITGPLAVRR